MLSVCAVQEDALLATTTPREALTFAAALRLPSPTFTQQQRAAAVDDLLLGMRLLRCADTLVSAAGTPCWAWFLSACMVTT